jgi:hypothetical protein
VYRAEFRLPNGSNGLIVGDFHAYETVIYALQATGAVWNEEADTFELDYPPGVMPTAKFAAEKWEASE